MTVITATGLSADVVARDCDGNFIGARYAPRKIIIIDNISARVTVTATNKV